MLVINRNRRVGVEALLGAVWEQRPPSGARASLHSYVSSLRSLIGSTGIDARTTLRSVVPGYRLNADEIDCDIGRFVNEKNAGVQAAATAHFETASRHFAAALAQWRGTVLEDLRDFQFVEAYATALIQDEVYVHTARAEAEIICGRWYAVIGKLEKLIIGHPYHEPLWAQLITAYYLSERQSDAISGSTPGPPCGNCRHGSCVRSPWTSRRPLSAPLRMPSRLCSSAPRSTAGL